MAIFGKEKKRKNTVPKISMASFGHIFLFETSKRNNQPFKLNLNGQEGI